MMFTASVFVSILSVQCKLCRYSSNIVEFAGTEIATCCIRRNGVYINNIRLFLILNELSCDPSALASVARDCNILYCTRN